MDAHLTAPALVVAVGPDPSLEVLTAELCALGELTVSALAPRHDRPRVFRYHLALRCAGTAAMVREVTQYDPDVRVAAARCLTAALAEEGLAQDDVGAGLGALLHAAAGIDAIGRFLAAP